MDIHLLFALFGLFICYIAKDALSEKIFRTDGYEFGFFMTFVEISIITIMSTLFSKRKSTEETIPIVEVTEANKSNWPTRTELKYYAALTFVIAVSQGSGSAALNYVTFPVKVVFKSSKLLPGMFFGACVTGRLYAVQDYFAALCLCVSLITLALADFQSPQNSVSTPDTSKGVSLLLVAICADALVPNFQEKLLKQLLVPANKMIFWSNLGSLVLVLVFILINGEIFDAVVFLRSSPITAMYLGLQALCGFVGLHCYLYFVRRYGAVAGITATSCRKGFTLVLSYVLFKKPFTWMHASSIAFLGLLRRWASSWLSGVKAKNKKTNCEKLPQSSTSTRIDQSNDVGGSVGKDDRDGEEDEGMDGQRSSQLQDNKYTDTGADAQMKRHCTDVRQHNAMTSI